MPIIEEIFNESKQSYGARKITEILRKKRILRITEYSGEDHAQPWFVQCKGRSKKAVPPKSKTDGKSALSAIFGFKAQRSMGKWCDRDQIQKEQILYLHCPWSLFTKSNRLSHFHENNRSAGQSDNKEGIWDKTTNRTADSSHWQRCQLYIKGLQPHIASYEHYTFLFKRRQSLWQFGLRSIFQNVEGRGAISPGISFRGRNEKVRFRLYRTI